LRPERRKDQRRGFHLPVQVRGFERGGVPWEELTTTEDASSDGISVRLNHAVAMGQVLYLALPLPDALRRHDFGQPSYRIYSLVRYAVPGRPPVRVGLMFLGRNPPRGYEENPTGLFLLPSDAKPAFATRRAFKRHPLEIKLRLRRLNPPPHELGEEVTISEDISQGGAKVRTSLPITRGEYVEVQEIGGKLLTRAIVQNVAIGKDNVPRLNLQFLDPEAAGAVKEILRRGGIHE
jgi:hypothetical protein